jgi:transposase/uncharacterized coiled-coil protein SlyX
VSVLACPALRRCNQGVGSASGLGDRSREELVALLAEREDQLAERNAHVAAQDRQITALSRQVAELAEANEELSSKLAKLEHLLSRNSGNSSMPESKDTDPGRKAPPEKPARGGGGPKRRRGKQPGAPGTHLSWRERPDAQRDRFPQGCCSCGAELEAATDLGVVDCYQAHEIPELSVMVTQYDCHQVRCGCGATHIASRPDGARSGPVGYGPNLQAFAVYLMVAHALPVARTAELLEALTGAAPSVGFCHGMLSRAAAALSEVDKRIRALITMAYVVCADETPLRVGPKTPKPGRKKAERYLLVACTECYTHYLLGDRDLATFKASVLTELAEAGTVLVHDRYQLYDSPKLDGLIHQLCCAHLLRDLQTAAETYPEAIWPVQIAEALRGLIHQANLARDAGHADIEVAVRNELITRLTQGVRVGLSETTAGGKRPGQRKTRLLLELLRDRPDDVLRFAYDLRIPPTSNQAERDLRPAKVQQKISGRLTSSARTQERYTICGYLSTAAKHGHNGLAALREAIIGRPWMPEIPAPT